MLDGLNFTGYYCKILLKSLSLLINNFDLNNNWLIILIQGQLSIIIVVINTYDIHDVFIIKAQWKQKLIIIRKKKWIK